MSYKFGPVAEYGTNLIPSGNLALLRGTGNFNPGPKYEQSKNRGPAYSQALNAYNYQQTQQGTNPIYQTQVPESRLAESLNYPSVVYPSDIENQRKYQVGSTSFHSEEVGSWKRPDFEGSRGSDQYQVWAINALHMTPNNLLNLFFSEANVNYLQDRIIQEIKNIRDTVIAKQSIDELLIIMKNKYTYALSGYLNHPGENKPYPRGSVKGPNSAYYENGLEIQLSLLNKSVIEECVKSILSGIIEYEKYYKDASSLPMPLSHPVLSSNKGSKALQENLAFESSHNVSNAMSSYNQRFNII